MSASIQLKYLGELIRHMNVIVPANERHLFHIIFGDRIIATYKTRDEMNNDLKELLLKNVCVIGYIPFNHLTTKIQSLWRGYSCRYDTAAGS